jgi:hypothetical protein
VRTGLDLEASLEISAAHAAEGLAELFAPVIGPDESFDLTALFTLRNRKLRHCREQLAATDLEHRDQVEELTRLIHQRDALAKSLGDKLVNLRRVCLGLTDETELVRLGLAGAVSQDPVVVYRQGQKAWMRFQKPGLELRSPEWMDVRIRPETLVTALGTDVQELSTHLAEISRQRRRVQTAAAARRRADEDFDRCYQLIGRSTAADYRMAGLEAEAERVRPPRRRGGREVEDEEPVDETGDDSETEPDAGTGDVEPTGPDAGGETPGVSPPDDTQAP